jgi:hypothetical protein
MCRLPRQRISDDHGKPMNSPLMELITRRRGRPGRRRGDVTPRCRRASTGTA